MLLRTSMRSTARLVAALARNLGSNGIGVWPHGATRAELSRPSCGNIASPHSSTDSAPLERQSLTTQVQPWICLRCLSGFTLSAGQLDSLGNAAHDLTLILRLFLTPRLPPRVFCRPFDLLQIKMSAAARPTVSVYSVATGETSGSVALPAVLTAPIRRDVVHFVHSNIAKNHRQAYAVSKHAGEQTSAESWGTGRAVARIPRISGGGTNRSGQGAFGNMCRKGRMFAPTKIWRRWHRHVNVNQRRYALVSALAASAVPALVQARGHRISDLPEVRLSHCFQCWRMHMRQQWACFTCASTSIVTHTHTHFISSCDLQVPLVVSGLEAVVKTKQAIAAFNKVGAGEDLKRAEESKRLRAGKGKARNRRFVVRRGPLFVHTDAEATTQKAVRNLPGVDTVHVDRLNLLQLAPGGHLGRFVIWTQSAFERLNQLYGTTTTASELKKGYKLPRPQMSNADLARIINSNEIQSAVRPAVKDRQWARQKKNPLRNNKALFKLNPYAAIVRKSEIAAAEQRAKAKADGVKRKRTGTQADSKRRAASKAFHRAVSSDDFVRPADAKA